ncbi:antibiotic biosynthesis monooxygenase [Flavobacterium sp. JLP]|uniref:putative quinol monooxygenase n=1 Tax=Flavobacterium sp. JLP TaxID=2783793 RepID=UPI00188C000F|nr:putative quinol monooxygenase [Flavobacterium sp. JLP]MBF4507674.1 antibiotic biosynthesis monooxygenase [Flavobacterium sp. JLP]
MKNQKPIHVFATWKVIEGQIENVLNLLEKVQEESVKESGNLFYEIHQGNSDLHTIVLFEGYSSESAIEEHRNSSHFQDLVLGKIVPLLEKREIILTTPVTYL